MPSVGFRQAVFLQEDTYESRQCQLYLFISHRGSRTEHWGWTLAICFGIGAETLPDICGGIAFPEIVKRYRDGRAVLDRNQRPTRDVGNQYIRWFDTYAAHFFKVSAQDISPYICGERCWQLRCEYLHQNKGFANTEDNTSIRFHLGVNCGTSVCQLDRISSANSLTDIRIDIEQFCRRMCQAARAYYEAVHTEEDFNLYNTPVLDFISDVASTANWWPQE